MQFVQLDDFLMYNFLSEVRMNPGGKGAAYIVSSADAANNGYTSDLYYLRRLERDCTSIRLSHSGKVGSYAWLDGERLAYAEQKAPDEEAPFGHTEIYAAGLYEDAAPRLLFSVEGAARIEAALSDGRLVLTRVDNLKHLAALEGLSGEAYREKAAALKADDALCTVFDEYPFWFNGRGVINKTRKAVYVCAQDGSGWMRVTPQGFRTEYVSAGGDQIAYTGCEVNPVESYLTAAYVWDARTGGTVCVQPGEVCHIDGIALWNGRAAMVSSKMDRYSVSQCPDIIVADPATGERRQLCGWQDELNVGNPVASDCRLGGGYAMRGSGDWLYFITGVADDSHVWRINLEGRTEVVSAQRGSVDAIDVLGETVCMVAMREMRLQELYCAQAGGKDARITSWNDDFYLAKPPIAPECCNFVNADGVEIHGFVIKPADYRPDRKYPVILDIHGGPHLSYGAVYYHEMQYWANHGYFVIYCNPRGGEGRGNEFGLLSGKFGTIDYDDIMAFCDAALEAYPAMDAGRMGVTGGSYGGFMTNWIIGHTDRFAAAASQRGISNFVSMEGTSDIGTLFAKGQVNATTHTDVEKMWRHSPLKYADRCKTPTLFIHAEQDYRCWMVEALQMYTALINNGVPTRLCLFHNENHELSRSGKPNARIRRLTEITNWMDRYLKTEQA